MAKLYFSYSTMNAGKSTLLLQASYNYRERGMRTLLFTSGALRHGRRSASSTSRIGISADADLFHDRRRPVRSASARKPCSESKVDCVLVDEAQFLTADQVWQLARVADRLGIPVMAFGLRIDFQGKLFPGSSRTARHRRQLREIRTICYCGAKATMVVRKDERGPRHHRRQPGVDRKIGLCLALPQALGRRDRPLADIGTRHEHRERPSPRAPSPSARSRCPPTPTPPATFSAAG